MPPWTASPHIMAATTGAGAAQPFPGSALPLVTAERPDCPLLRPRRCSSSVRGSAATSAGGSPRLGARAGYDRCPSLPDCRGGAAPHHSCLLRWWGHLWLGGPPHVSYRGPLARLGQPARGPTSLPCQGCPEDPTLGSGCPRARVTFLRPLAGPGPPHSTPLRPRRPSLGPRPPRLLSPLLRHV